MIDLGPFFVVEVDSKLQHVIYFWYLILVVLVLQFLVVVVFAVVFADAALFAVVDVAVCLVADALDFQFAVFASVPLFVVVVAA